MPTPTIRSPRIAPLAEPLPPAVAERMSRLVPNGMKPPQLFLTVARNQGLFNALVDSGLLGPTGLWDRRVLSRRLRETVILRTCVAAGNDYEFNLHVQTISERMGLTLQQIEDLRQPLPSPEFWEPGEHAAMQLVDALVRHLAVADEVFAEARAHHDDATLLEIVQLTGFYTQVAMMVAMARPELDRYRPGPVFLATPDTRGEPR
jgi:4-carboxymuconolactone decarboxylase